MEIVPSEATLGASIYGVNLHQLDERTGKRIIEAWHEYGVLAFPEQHLDDEAHITFSRRFGPLERLLTTAIEGTKPEIFRVANVLRTAPSTPQEAPMMRSIGATGSGTPTAHTNGLPQRLRLSGLTLCPRRGEKPSSPICGRRTTRSTPRVKTGSRTSWSCTTLRTATVKLPI